MNPNLFLMYGLELFFSKSSFPLINKNFDLNQQNKVSKKAWPGLALITK